MMDHLQAIQGLLQECQQEQQEQIIKLFADAKDWLNAQDLHQEATAETLGGTVDAEVTATLVFIARSLAQQRCIKNGKQACTLGLPLSTIASSSGTNVFDFFREFPVVAAKLAPFLESHGTSKEQIEQQFNIVEWQKTMLTLMLLAKKYKELFSKYMRTLEQYKQVVLRLGWAMFIVLKPRLLPKFPDLVSCVELLVCCINVLVAHLPALPEEITASRQQGHQRPVEHPNGQVDTLLSITSTLRADPARVASLMASVEPVLRQLLPTYVAEWRITAGAHPQAGAVATHCTHYPGLVTHLEMLNVCVAGLEREYESAVLRSGAGEVDERECLFLDFARFASPRMSPRTAYGGANPHATLAGLQHTLGAQAGGLASPLTPGKANGRRLGPGAFSTGPRGQALLSLAPQSMPLGLQSPTPLMAMHMANHQAQQGAPYPGIMAAAATPISEAMVAAAWLRSLTSTLAPMPSSSLRKIFSTCDPDPAAVIHARAQDMAAAVLPQEQAAPAGPFQMLQPQLMTERRTEALKLYYHVLEAVITTEVCAMTSHYGAGSTAARAAVSNLLTSAKFHKGLLACCLEVVITCCKMVSCTFPWVLIKLKLKAFDLSKMVQPFVRTLPSLPMELKKHLFQVEEKVVESLAWESGSSLYPLLVAVADAQQATRSSSTSHSSSSHAPHHSPARKPAAATASNCSAAANNQHHGGDQVDMEVRDAGQGQGGCEGAAAASQGGGQGQATASKRSHSAFSSLMSPMKKARGEASPITTQPAAFTEPLPAGVGRPPPAHVLLQGAGAPGSAALGVLHDFLRKALKLAWVRVAWLCQSFDLQPLVPKEVHHKVYETVEHALYFHTSLFYNRHIDQVILSSFYGYCKAHKLAHVTFKEIIAQYKRQPQACNAVFRSCVLAQSNPGLVVQSRGDIIAFYNHAYVPIMKQYLLKGEAAAHPVLGLPPMAPPAHARSPGGRHHVHVQHHHASPPPSSGGAGHRAPSPPSPSGGGVSGGGAGGGTLSGHSNGSVGRGKDGMDADGITGTHQAVNAALKQTISGFFPSLGRTSPTNGSGALRPPTQQQGLVGIAAKFAPPPAPAPPPPLPPPPPPAPAVVKPKPSPITIPMEQGDAGGVPVFSAPARGPRRASDRMPSGIATLLRALDSTSQGGGAVQGTPSAAADHIAAAGASKMNWNDADANGGAVAAPPRPASPGFTFAVIKSASDVLGMNAGTPPLKPRTRFASHLDAPPPTPQPMAPLPASPTAGVGGSSPTGEQAQLSSPECAMPSPSAWLQQAPHAAPMGGPSSPGCSNASSGSCHPASQGEPRPRSQLATASQ